MKPQPTPSAARPQQERRQQVHRLLRFDLLVRWSILSTSTVTCLLAWFVPNSLTALLLHDGGSLSDFVLLALTLSVFLGYVDFLINDVLPVKFVIKFLKENRHLGYSLIGGIYMLQTFVSVGSCIGPEDLLPLGYLMNAFVCGWYSWVTAWGGWHV